MKSILAALSLVVTMAACSDGTKRPGGMDSALPGSLGTALYVAMSMDDVAGTYTGVLPCADCPGIETTLVLNGNETYRLETRYQGKGNEMPSYVTEGHWALEDDKIKLEGMNDAPDIYQVESGYLVQLDMDGKKIEGALAEQYVLKKK